MKKIFILLLIVACLVPSFGGLKAATVAPSTNVPTEIKDQNGNSFEHPAWIKAINNQLYFSVAGKFYKYNPVTKALTLLTDNIGYWAMNVTEMNGNIYFATNYGSMAIGKTDGTPAGTVEVLKVNYGDIGERNQYFTVCNNKIFYYSGDGEIMVSNGDVGNKTKLPVPGFNYTDFYCVNNRAIFAASDGVHGRELWKSDGTVSGTALLKDINPSGDGVWDSQNVALVGNNLYFDGNDGVHNFELWKTDGTTAGTVMVKDINVGSAKSNLYNFMNINGVLYFRANDGVTGQQIWKSDGTSAGTVVYSKSTKFTVNSIIGYLGSNLIVSEYSYPNHGAIWKTDGTDAGTSLIKDGVGTYFSKTTNVGGKLYFYSVNATYGEEIWVTDGTTNGTYMIKDMMPGSHGSRTDWPWEPPTFANINGVIYFDSITIPIGEWDSVPPALWQYDTNSNENTSGLTSVGGFSGICVGGSKKNPPLANNDIVTPTLTTAQLNKYKGRFINDGNANIFYIDPRTKRLSLVDTNNVLEYLTKIGIGVKDATLNKIANLSDTTVTAFSKRYANTVLLQIQNKCILWYVNPSGKKAVITNPLGLVSSFAVSYSRWKYNVVD